MPLENRSPRKYTMPLEKRLRKQYAYLEGLPKSSSPERKQRWEELRSAIRERAGALKKQLRELEKAKAQKRALELEEEHIARKAAQAGKEVSPPKRMYTREELLKNLNLRIKILDLKILLALSEDDPRKSLRIGKLNSDLVFLTETRDTILQRKKYFPGIGHGKKAPTQ